LQLNFVSPPKILGQLVDKRHLTVSFKLETDINKIEEHIKYAIKQYNVDMVVGNILNNKNWVQI
jgi:phosphopantothenoylcysteine synthetase/decarboxylase